MIKIKEAIVVEGNYDKIKLSGIVDATIVVTDGFMIFKNKQLMKMLSFLAEKNGILILTDSDSAGFKIRSFLGGSIPKEKVTHAYIPDVLGKEKRKTEPSKEGKIGVEGMRTEALMTALEKAGVFCEETKEKSRAVQVIDLFEDGISGGENSKSRREKLLKFLDLPQRLSTSALIDMINTFMSFEEYKAAVKRIDEDE